MSFTARFAALRSGTGDIDAFEELAGLALDEGEEERALPLVASAALRLSSARLWQWTGLLHRALDTHDAALDAFDRAARLAPGDAGIAQGRAQVAFEAGLDAVALFEAARRLAPAKGDVLTGLAAARFAVGQGDAAEAELDAILAQAPLWLQGHMQLAQLRAVLGRSGTLAASLERALVALPHEGALWRGLCELHLLHADHAGLAACVARARAAGQQPAFFADYEAIAAIELGEGERVDALLTKQLVANAPALAVWHVRHLLRTRQDGPAVALIDRELAAGGARAAAIWPYALTAWQLAGDPRAAWLVDDPRLIGVIDLADRLPPLDRLADLLRSLHIARGEYVDQSVRGGTQTDGPLLRRIDPMIRALRTAIVEAVATYVAQLPPPDPSHPLLASRRDRAIRFAGSWSVRLRGAGYHDNHVHPQGWISSALYVAVPERAADEPRDAGWLVLGEPQAALGLDLPTVQRIEPKPGRLVLFPSWLWHGTRPFADGERLTVAFDVAPPR